MSEVSFCFESELGLSSSALAALHYRLTQEAQAHRSSPRGHLELSTWAQESELWEAIAANHRCNLSLWDQEDEARRPDIALAELGARKRSIDQLNRQRHDWIQAIDVWLESLLGAFPLKPNAWLNSESVGSLVDRLSIVSLKIRSVRAYVALNLHKEPALEREQRRLEELVEQYDALNGSLDRLLQGRLEGEVGWVKQRPHKLYHWVHLSGHSERGEKVDGGGDE